MESGGVRIRSLYEIHKDYESIVINRAMDRKQKMFRLAALMDEINLTYKLYEDWPKQKEQKNRKVVSLYRKIANSR
ncbi:hypothetical protein LRR81_07490 [Metabacillus sp. GX 13764]|uniref:hypothetical protein n=1 Tax=Metabacillus kandeliae TaxID=2900151 RepID=UPI001E32AF3F|nr:hypothetical protein [Metabacillus kandeliae]MCD7034072.1 hypothetical protein [Metabacillus kandeliae]